MKIIITESQYNLLRESKKSRHFDERLIERLYYDKFDVVFKGELNGRKIKEIVGKYELTPEHKSKINEKIKILSGMDFPIDQKIGFIVHHFDINGTSDIIFDSENDRLWLKKLVSINENPVFFVLDPSKNLDDYRLAQVALVLIEDNTLITIMYSTIMRLTPRNAGEFDYIGDDIEDLKRHYNL